MRDLVAHLVVRERRPDTLPGLFVPALARHTDRVRDRLAAQPLERLVERFRQGPPRWSPTRLRPVDEAMNTMELLIHHQDIVRGRPGWAAAGDEPAWVQRAAWRALRTSARLLHRSTDHPVLLVAPGHGTVEVPGEGAVEVRTGRPLELLLHASGRTSRAAVALGRR